MPGNGGEKFDLGSKSESDALILFTMFMLLKVFLKTLRAIFNLQNRGVSFLRHIKIPLSVCLRCRFPNPGNPNLWVWGLGICI